MSKYSGTLLPQTNEPQEIQKGMLDLLDKINAVAEPASAGAASVKNITADYAVTPGDGVYDLLVTTGATTITVTLDGTANRTLRVWKLDSGAGEVKVIGCTLGATTQTIDGFAAVYVGLRYQHVAVYQTGKTCYLL